MKISKRVKDLTNQRFGKLSVIKFVGLDRHNKARWLCVCDCGRQTTIRGTDLYREERGTKSCDCLQRELMSGKNNSKYVDGHLCGKRTRAVLDLKEECRRESNYICQECDKTQEQELEDIGMVLSVHHIDLDDSHNVMQNLYCICHSCHMKLHHKIKRLKKELILIVA